MNDKLSTILSNSSPSRPDEPDDLAEDEDCGACAAIAKNRWVTALTIKHATRPWESFLYKGLDTRCTFEPTRFDLWFVGEEETWRVVVTGRCLERVYMLCLQGRLEWVRPADRDFAADGQCVITGVEVTKVEAKKG